MVYSIIIAVIIALDQFTKYLVRDNIALNERIPVIGDWMNFTYIRNEGAAFSMFSGNVWVTVVLTSVLLILCIILIVKEHRNGSKILAVLLACVLGGGVSNMFDRLYFGYVTDMISCGSFAIFNVADMFVTCGCILSILYILFIYKDEFKEPDLKEKKDE